MGESSLLKTPKELHSQVKQTSSGRTSGETSNGAEGARRVLLTARSISQAKGQSTRLFDSLHKIFCVSCLIVLIQWSDL
ncbi:hypothetical protein DFR58_11635 [Anaerobacterium chartisolvens]|uniref:Uncharacterized protein n=1 Tax=Anaerobacterium chartisolvens TaxID=1297424 RepID=A0A369B045_9FIRM|nr:hypothetical protein DFR58_11635 [Anaerobacterium chartisolvens]